MGNIQINFESTEATRILLGTHEINLKQIATAAGVEASSRGTQITISGPPKCINLANLILTKLYKLIRQGYTIYEIDILSAIRILSVNPDTNINNIFLDQIFLTKNKRTISPKTITQKKYLDAMRSHDIVFGIGPAGTGKTYLAMAIALDLLIKKKVEHIILARPAVEAGEKLGFLPGDLAEKVNPYLRPLYDALHDMINFEKVAQLIEKGVIEIAPLAFMRGRTLNASFIIMDEAQNATSEQMKMFLTRLGLNSRAVITGDITQVDLPSGTRSGLIEACRILSGIQGISVVNFSDSDVVRHHLVREIIKVYEREKK